MPETPFSDDELLSSALDGELSAVEKAALDVRLLAEPALADRYELLSQAESLAATPVTPLPDADRERMLAAALGVSTTSANVTDLAAAGARRSAWKSRGIAIAAAAAALAIAVPAFNAINSADNDYSTSGESADTASAPVDDAVTDDPADLEESSLSAASAFGDEDAGDDTAANAEMDVAADDAMPAPEAPVEGDGVDSSQGAALLYDGLLSLPDADFFDANTTATSFATDLELVEDFSARWSVFTSANDEPSDTVDPVVARSLAYGRLVDLVDGNCPDLVDTLDSLDIGGTVVSAGYGDAVLEDNQVIVIVAGLDDGTAALVVVDPDTCNVTLEALLP